MAVDEHDWYGLLGVSPASGLEEVRQAYKREALRHHPDKNRDRVDEATERFKLVAEAYTVLSDPQSRAEYDARLRQCGGGAPRCAREGGGSASFTVGRASDVFREVFGSQFTMGLLRAAREAAPHVRAVAEATRSALVGAWDRLTTPPPGEGSRERSASPRAAASSSAPAPERLAAGSAPAHSAYTQTDVLHVLPQGQQLRCALRWIAGGSGAEFALSAHLAGCGGTYLGSVDRELSRHAANVAEQFRECGIEHLGCAPSAGQPPQNEEVIRLDLERLRDSEICSYAFLRVRAEGGGGRPSGPTLVDLEVAAAADGQGIFTVELTGCSAIWDERGVVAALLVRDGGGWAAIPVLLPCGGESPGDAALEDTISRLAGQADCYLRRHKEEQREAAEVAAAISAVEVALAADKTAAPSSPALSAEDEELVESIKVYAEHGNFARAVEGQEALLRRLMEYDELDRAGAWQPRISSEFARMDELWSCVSEAGATGAAASSSSQAAPVPPALREQPAGTAGLAEELERPLQPSSCSEAAAAAAGAQPAVDSAVEPVEEPVACSPRSASDDLQQQSDLASGPVCPQTPPRSCMSPRTGSSKGGAQILWKGEGPAPLSMTVDGRPCAPLDGGVFVLPSLHRASGLAVDDVTHVDMCVDMPDGRRHDFPGEFAYWLPGTFRGIDPPAGPITGCQEVRVTTSDLGAPISEVLIGGVACTLVGEPSSREAAVCLPPAQHDGVVDVEVRAGNGNGARSDAGFSYTTPEVFGWVGEHVELSAAGRRATRKEGVSGGVCVGAFPLRRTPEGCFFEVLVEETCKSIRAMAVGMRAGRLHEDELLHGRVRASEARELERVWLAGYDKAGAVFLSDGEEAKVPTAAWRPVKDVKVGSRIGVLWAEPQRQLVVYQDGEERLRLQGTGRLPEGGEEVFAVVDVHGTARCISFVEGSVAPASEVLPEQ